MMRPYPLPLVASFILVMLLLAACSDGDDDSVGTTLALTSTTAATTTTVAPAMTIGGQAVAVTEVDLVYATWEERPLTLDISAPSKPAVAPIVVYLPGRGGHSAPPELVDGLVAEGAFVFVVRYAALNSRPERILADHGADLGAQAQSVACAIQYARAQASEFGNNDRVVALTGLSNGGALGAHVALFGADIEARWDQYAAAGGPPRQVECEVTDGSTHVDVLVGVNAPYDVFVPIIEGKYGRTHQQYLDPELLEFLSSPIGVNPDLKICLIHAESDAVVPYEASVKLTAALTDAGYDVGEVIAFDGEHHWVPPELVIPIIMELIGP